MTNRFIAVLLAISLAACSSVPRFGPAQTAGPANSVPSPLTAADRESTGPQQDDEASKPAPERPDTVDEKKSHLVEIGKGIVMVALITLMVWLQYRATYPYDTKR